MPPRALRLALPAAKPRWLRARICLPWVAGVVALFAVGWWVGTHGGSRHVPTGRAPGILRALNALGLGAPRFTVHVTSEPAGAVVRVDGRTTSLTTPVDLDLARGLHRIGIGVPEYGEATFVVRGEDSQRVALAVPLAGSLRVLATDAKVPVAIAVDGQDHGLAPTLIPGVAPGPHEVEFTAPGQQPWSQTVRVPVRDTVTIIARAFDPPATGLLVVRATLAADEAGEDLPGAAVWVDGRRRGVTPLTLELPRGPHSVRVTHRGEAGPVRVINLPGGNQRYASFSLGTGADPVRLILDAPRSPLPAGVTAVIVARLPGLWLRDLREMWLHVRAPEGTWRRYAMSTASGPDGVSGSVAFPDGLLDRDGHAPFYVSVLTTLGEEYFSDITSAPTARGAQPAEVAGVEARTPTGAGP